MKIRVVQGHYLKDKAKPGLLSFLQVGNIKITPDKEIEEKNEVSHHQEGQYLGNESQSGPLSRRYKTVRIRLMKALQDYYLEN